MPLVKNNFNKSKSDLKYIESCACGAVAIGSYFDDETSWVNQGPYYNCLAKVKYKATVEDIDKLFNKLCEPEVYNDILSKQYAKLVEDGRYLESVQYVDNFIKPFI